MDTIDRQNCQLSFLCYFFVMHATGKADNDIQLKVSSKNFKFPSNLPFSLIVGFAWLLLYTNMAAVISFAQICPLKHQRKKK